MMKELFIGSFAWVSIFFTLLAESNSHFVQPVLAGRDVKITGFTRAHSTMPLAAEVEGKVEKVLADIGDQIAKDTIFACLDDTFVKLDIKSAVNEIMLQKIDIDFFSKEVKRHEALVKKNSVSISALDRLKKDLGNAKNASNAAYIKKLRLKELADRHCVKAPFGWRVIARDVEPGQWVNVGEKLGEVGDYSKLVVPLTLSAAEFNALKQSQHDLKVTLLGHSARIPARIEKINPAFDEQSRKIQVELLLLGALAESRGGIRVEVSVNLPEAGTHTFFIAKDAVEERYEEYWVYKEDGSRVKVRYLGAQQDDKVKINSSDIKPGDRLKILR